MHGLDAATTIPLWQRIKRIIVLMEENRSYDHMMGWNNKSSNGLTGKEYNLLNASDPNSTKIFVSKNAPYLNDCDPNHSLPATSYKIFGPQAYNDHNYSKPLMDAFVDYEHRGTSYCDVMEGFPPQRVPVMTALADNFVSFDKFFCSVPGPTWPNRLFFLAGTSAGLTETWPWYRDVMGEMFPVKTIMDQVGAAGGSWKYYYHDTPWELFVQSLAHSPENIFNIDEFYSDCKEGTLPNFAFINPRSGVNLTTGFGSNDMHPDHDIALSEKLYKDVYEALRASPQWNETLFILTFDEHGGFYDHITPPQGIPPPGDYNFSSYPDVFSFDRGGIRIPTLMASPWLPKGYVESDPPAGQKPAPNSAYELTSIMATVRKLLPFMNETGPLTKRDAWAATFEHLFMQLDEPRTDCPMWLPDPPAPATLPPGQRQGEAEGERPVNHLQEFILTVNAHLAGVAYPKHIDKQKDVGQWAHDHYQKHRTRTLDWKRSKTSINFNFQIVPYIDPSAITCYWHVNRNRTVAFDTVSIVVDKEEYCLDSGNQTTVGTPITLSLCYPSSDPQNNRDPSQHWVFTPDYTFRPRSNQSLCITSDLLTKHDRTLHLEPCASPVSVWQSFAYMGTAPGMSGGGGPNEGTHHIYNGDDYGIFCATSL